jgi:lipopolysaccharide export LptBFGC system permease protein LptF
MAATNVTPELPTQKSGFGRFWHALKQLFHEVVGAVFAVLAFAWVQSAIRAWTRDGARWLVATAFVVAAVMAVFSFTSFRRARRV